MWPLSPEPKAPLLHNMPPIILRTNTSLFAGSYLDGGLMAIMDSRLLRPSYSWGDRGKR